MATPIDGLKATTPKGKTITLPMHDFYATADQGPFRCDNCEHYSAGTCNEPYVVQHHGADVAPGDCCDMFSKGDES